MFAHAFGTSSHSPDVLLSVPICLAADADTERCVGDLSPLPSVTPLQAPRGRGPPPTNDRVVSPATPPIGTGGSGVVGTPAPLSKSERSRPLCLAAELSFAWGTVSRQPRREVMTRGHDLRWVSHPDARTPSVPAPNTVGVRGEEAIVANQGYKLLQKETVAHNTMSHAIMPCATRFMPCATWFNYYSMRTRAHYTMLYYYYYN